jgi:hypothetical protein
MVENNQPDKRKIKSVENTLIAVSSTRISSSSSSLAKSKKSFRQLLIDKFRKNDL